MGSGLRRDVAEFLKSKGKRTAEARQMAALQIACHFDLAEALATPLAARRQIMLRLERTIERERQRGIRRHWSYDLNRHIALKQALETLRGAGTDENSGNRRSGCGTKSDGARRRRRKLD